MIMPEMRASNATRSRTRTCTSLMKRRLPVLELAAEQEELVARDHAAAEGGAFLMRRNTGDFGPLLRRTNMKQASCALLSILEHAGEEGVAREVARHPELVVADVLDPEALGCVVRDPEDLIEAAPYDPGEASSAISSRSAIGRARLICR